MHKLTFVHAPAGFGKTTLLYQWRDILQENDSCVAWYMLDEGDNDSVTFKEYLVASLELALGDTGSSSDLGRVQADDIRSPPSFITSIVNELGALEREIVLIIDDFHLVTDSRVIQSVYDLVSYAPPNFHLIIASRALPQFSISNLVVYGHALELNGRALRLNEEEINNYLQDVQGISLSDEERADILSQTEGWAAGLHMASLAIRQKQPGERVNLNMGQGSLALQDFLIEQVLNKQSPEMKSFLLSTAFLPRLNAEICNEVAGVDNANEMLAEASSKGLFVVPLDGNWYRYHHIFSAFLQDFAKSHCKDILSDIVAKSCNWLESHKRFHEAVVLALQAEEYELAEDFITRYALELLRRGMTTTMLSWLSQLPKPISECDLTLQLYVAWAMVLVRKPDEAKALLDGIDEKNADRDQNLKIHSEIARYGAMAWSENQSDAKKRMKEIYATGLVQDPWDIAAVHNIISYCCTVDGDIVEATKAYQKVLLHSNAPYPIIYSKVLMGMCLKARGQLHEAAALFEDAMILAENESAENSVSTSLASANLAEIFYEWNDLAACSNFVEPRMDVIDETSLNDVLISVYSFLVRVREQQQNYGEATKLIQHALELAYSQPYGLRLEAALLFERLCLLLNKSYLKEAQDQLAQMEMRFKKEAGEDSFTSHQVQKHFAKSRARVLLAQGDFGEAKEIILELIGTAKQENKLYDVLKLRGFLAMLVFLSGEVDEACKMLHELLADTSPHNLIRSFIDLGKSFRQLFVQYLQTYWGTESETGETSIDHAYINRLLEAFEIDEFQLTTVVMNDDEQEANLFVRYGLSERQQQIIVAIAKGETNKQIASSANISVDTIKWHMKQIFQKLGVKNRTDVVRKAHELRMI
ncbi:LuxR C-terminal-related transcriptional regulator [Halioxenophilus sp. WMMB6]|uniref:LuxR C-terminal-related transcriptional regulator n=1 Tax=Halioxenophilus sp. WMMB6 TaxID=3073815 RepID=UPI00295EA292|nr:LuxR C-terminal-related transcriptional regulator [Halioxenophilus sp. WMMB6]